MKWTNRTTTPPVPHQGSLRTSVDIFSQDIITGDEILSDTFKIIDVGDGLWEVDLKMITKGAENFGICWSWISFPIVPDI